MDWFKVYSGASIDPKYQLIAHKSGLKTHQIALIWWAILDHASRENDRGEVTGIDCESLDFFYQFEDGTTLAAIKAFEEKGMIQDGRISKWDDRQKSDAAERQKRYRERKKSQETECDSDVTLRNGHNTRNGDVTLRNGDVSLLEERRGEEKRIDKKEKDTKVSKKKVGLTLSSKVEGKTVEEWFEDFWEQYPSGPQGRKGSKQKAKQSFVKALNSDASVRPSEVVRKAISYSSGRPRLSLPTITKQGAA